MNDISVKLVESPKVAESPVTAGANEIDPLAIDDGVKSKDSPEEVAPDLGSNAEDGSSTGQNEDNQILEIQPDVEVTPAVIEEPAETTEPIKSVLETSVSKPLTHTNVDGEIKVTEAVAPTPESETKINTVEEDHPISELNSPNTDPAITEDNLESTSETVETKPKSVEFESALVELQEITDTAPDTLESAIETLKSVTDTEEPVIEIKKSPEARDSKQESVKSKLETDIAHLETQALICAIKTPSLEVTAKISSPEIVAILTPEVITNLQAQKTEGSQEKSTDVEMAELPPPKKIPTPPAQASAVEEKKVLEKELKRKEVITVRNFEKERASFASQSSNVNGDIAKEDHATKRRASEEVETESPLKKLCQEVERTFVHHDSMVNDYIQTTTRNNIDEIQRHTEQLLAEIQTLRELAQKKEYEWNNILHLKKVKEEILLRLLRRKQVLLFEKNSDVNGSDRTTDPFDYLNQAKNLAIDKSDEISGLAIKQPGSTISPMMQTPIMPVTTLQSHFNPMSGLPPPYDKAAQPHMSMPKPVFPQPMMMPGMPGFPRDMNGQLPANFNMPMGRQGPTKDVKSIIADYRQRNPDVTPRRGRRMKSILNPNMMNAPRSIAPKVDGLNNLTSMNSMNNLSNLNLLFNNLDMTQKAMLERLQQLQVGGLQNSIFKDALVQFANMQQASSGLIPPPNRPDNLTARPDHHVKERRRERPAERAHESPPPAGLKAGAPRVPPPPYPEISLLPVAPTPGPAPGPAPTPPDAHSQNSLLHGILTKQAGAGSVGVAGCAGDAGGAGASSPTLARLLTSPEHRAALSAYGQAKNCGEITITPVQPTPPEPQPDKTEDIVQLADEESAASEGEAASSPAGSAGRLVIDECGADSDTPLCQGCRRRDALFVCAGCANQWYCSRDCQVASWDDHSETCSG